MTIVIPSALSVSGDSSMTFLQLCQRLNREAGGTSGGPTTVDGQTGDLARAVGWVQDSWRDIQKAKRSWRWLFDTVAIPIAAGTNELSLAQIIALTGMTRHAYWKPDAFKYMVNSQGLASERPLVQRTFEREYRTDYGVISQATRPNRVAVMPDGGLRIRPQPTEDGTLTATRYRTAQMLAVDGDVPEMPGDFHMLIVWHALADFGVFEAASERWEQAQIKQDKMFKELMNDQLEPVESYATTIVE